MAHTPITNPAMVRFGRFIRLAMRAHGVGRLGAARGEVARHRRLGDGAGVCKHGFGV